MDRFGSHHGRYILDIEGRPVPCDDLAVWSDFIEHGNRIIAQDKDESAGPDGVMVSTVFLALDHQFGSGPPILWETLVLGGLLDGEMERYSSLAAAREGHQRMCARVRELST